MDKNLPIKFSWGLFCRRSIIDRDTGELSAIDITPALKVQQIQTVRIDSNNSKILINLGKMNVVAFFERVDGSSNKISESLNIEFSQSGFEPKSVKVEVIVESENTSAFINLGFEELTLIVPYTQQSSNHFFEVVYKIQEYQLGKLLLPVNVDFKILEETQNE